MGSEAALALPNPDAMAGNVTRVPRDVHEIVKAGAA